MFDSVDSLTGSPELGAWADHAAPPAQAWADEAALAALAALAAGWESWLPAWPPSGALLDTLAGLAAPELTDEQALTAAAAAERIIAHAQAVQLRLLARFALLRPG
jgi:hypothetical protein